VSLMVGGDIDILRALNPKMKIIKTSFGLSPWEHRVRPSCFTQRGPVLWEPPDKNSPRRRHIARGRDAAPYFPGLRGDQRLQSIAAPPAQSLLYSPASMHAMDTDWRAKGDTWANGTSRRA
jgi:hypothetical protein